MIDIWISSFKMTVLVTVNEQRIICHGPPILRKFKDQHLLNLLKWMKGQGGLLWQTI